MAEDQKELIVKMRHFDYGYRRIADKMHSAESSGLRCDSERPL